MRTIVHISDLHFGRIDHATLAPLVRAIHGAKPHVVVVSGDLTQRAKRREFEEAREFLASLPQPQIVVPGNHDVPLYNLYARSFAGLTRYRRHIHHDVEPFYCDGEIAVLGVNTARGFTFKGGRVNSRQVARIIHHFQSAQARNKILVAHHPFDLPEGFGDGTLVGRARMALTALAESGIDVFLSGHLHVAHRADAATSWLIGGHSSLIVQAGTATSTRGRGEANSFNILHVGGRRITVECLAWEPGQHDFTLWEREEFHCTPDGWIEDTRWRRDTA